MISRDLWFSFGHLELALPRGFPNGVLIRGSSVGLCFQGGATGKEPNWPVKETWRGGFHLWARKISLEEGMATHSGILSCRIPQAEEPRLLKRLRTHALFGCSN